MSGGFSPDWLALREPADVRARDQRLLAALAERLAGKDIVDVVDLGCGTGSNIRTTAPALGPMQRWTLVDYDPVLLAAARSELRTWADEAAENGEGISLKKAGRSISVRFRQADLMQELEAVIAGGPDVVTASALFDLCSTDYIARIGRAVAAERSVFYTVLTYDGEQSWLPGHAADADMVDAFNAHQHTDKGFGIAAGPEAPAALALAFRAAGYTVKEASTPWRIDDTEQALIDALADGFAGAVAETGRVAPDTIADWLSSRRNGCIVGHADTLALPSS